MALPPITIALKIALALTVGLLIGLEREWSNKDVGVRTFTLTALAGVIAAMLSQAFAITVLIGVFVLIALVNLRQIRVNQTVEITTASALILTYVLAAAIGEGYHYAPAAVAIVATLLLNWKLELHRFAGGLHPDEIRSAVWLGVLAFIIYPLLPNRPLDHWGLVNLHAAWVATVVVAAVGFGNYILLRLYSTKGLYYSALLGGVVNSTGAVYELGVSLEASGAGQDELRQFGIVVALLATIAMLVRNLALLAIFAPKAALAALPSIVVMAALSVVFLQLGRSARNSTSGEPLKLGSPVSLRIAFEFGALFLAVEILGTLAERHWGHNGFYLVSVIGGMFSSASTTTAAGQMSGTGGLAPVVAGAATVVTSATSAITNAVAMQRAAGSRGVGSRVWLLILLVAAAGLLTLPLTRWL